MVTTNDLVSMLGGLVDKEIDRGIIANSLSQLCNVKVEDVQDLVCMKVLGGYNTAGHRLMGIISIGEAKASIDLDYIDNKYIVKCN